MGDLHGFKNIDRKLPDTQDPTLRVEHYQEFHKPFSEKDQKDQSARCMDCGVPFCHNGCPLGNLIPDFNDAVFKGEWKEAYQILDSTNNFPEFTGRICPAPCESSCVLGINSDPVTIELIEKSIIERAFTEGWVKADVPSNRTGKKVAVVGSGPAGLAAADQLNKAGHSVTVFEKNDRIGGLLRYGIPDFKLEKSIIDRRLNIMKESGITFQLNCTIGVDISKEELQNNFDAVLLCCGSNVPRDLDIPGRSFNGVHFAMDFLEQSNRRVAGDEIKEIEQILVTDENVVVIGGGDTGSDCIGTSNRQKASSITQLEILAKPPNSRGEQTPWPLWPLKLRTSSSHDEGCEREWSVHTKAFVSDDGVNLSGIELAEIAWEKDENGKYSFKEVPDSSRVLPCSKVFLAMGFLHTDKNGLLESLGLDLDQRGNVKTEEYQTSISGVFACGDMRRGQSLVVWAISEGREAAIAVDEYLTENKSKLASKEKSLYAV